MNPSNPEMGANPEQRVRQELAASIVAESTGTLALRTSADFQPEDKQAMKEAFAERMPNTPDNRTFAGGWGDYGDVSTDESAHDASLDGQSPEQVLFVPDNAGNVKVAYGFNGGKVQGYSDATGRPGNRLTVQFTLSANKAQSLKEALAGDPSYINDVVKAQAKALGISENHWNRYMRPRTSAFETAAQMKDRVLDIRELNSAGQTVAAESLAYGENRSITEKLQTSEQTPESSSEQADPYTEKYAAYDKTFNEAFAAQREKGVSDSSLLEGLKTVHAQKMERIQTKEAISQQEVEELDIYLDVVEAHIKEIEGRIQEQVQKTESESAARQAVEAAHANVSPEQSPAEKYQIPEGSTFIESYQDARNNTWVVVRDANGVKRQVKQ